jgi:spore coat protein A, manganese oxidase
MFRLILMMGLSAMLSSSSGERIFGGFQKFVDPLPIPARIVAEGNPAEITVTIDQFTTKLHRDLPETTEWGYNGTSPGPIIEVEKDQALRVHWRSNLPATHLFPAPKGMGGMDTMPNMPDVRSVTHLHGAVVQQPTTWSSVNTSSDGLVNSDGWPDAWITPGQEQITDYPNPQEARTLWYHDHAMGETGRNVAAGLAGLYLIHDDYERSLNLPSGDFEVPLLLQSRGLNVNGTLYYSTDIGNEFYGNAATVNGKLYPYLNVEPRKYRFRIVNISNARTYALKWVDPKDQSAGPAIYQIGTDSGFLENTAVLDDPADPNSSRLMMAPAERADVIVDFTNYAGRSFALHNNHLDPGDAEIALPQLMMVNVGKTVSSPDTSSLPMQMRPIERMDPATAKATRQIVFSTMNMPDGSPMLMLNGKSWEDPITEKPELGTTEVWELINTLPDMHPFHIHLVDFQVLDRTPYDVDTYLKTGQINYTGPAESPDPNEMGRKDVVRVVPRMVTRIILNFGPYPGYYVYHCHILEHEDMDMMRPYEVVAPANGVHTSVF